LLKNFFLKKTKTIININNRNRTETTIKGINNVFSFESCVVDVSFRGVVVIIVVVVVVVVVELVVVVGLSYNWIN